MPLRATDAFHFSIKFSIIFIHLFIYLHLSDEMHDIRSVRTCLPVICSAQQKQCGLVKFDMSFHVLLTRGQGSENN